MKYLLFIAFVCSCFTINAQDKVPFISYDDVVAITVDKASKEDYKGALEELNRINKNDSTYCSVLTSKSYYNILLEKYDDAIAVTNEGLALNCDSQSKLYFYINKGVSLVETERFEEAIKVYDEALKTFPKNPKIWYNKGLAYERVDKTAEAIKAYQQTIIYNPIHRNAHLQLGNICYGQQLISQALMCYNMSLMIEPDSERGFALLKYMNEIASTKNENEPIKGLEVSIDDEAFEDIDLIINNRVVLNSDYDTKTKIEIPLVKQNHALLEQLKNIEGDGGFWDVYYIPFYKWIAENDHFNDFTYTLNYGIKNEDYKKVIERNKDEVDEFISAYVLRLYELFSDNSKREASFNYEEGVLQGEGMFKNNTLNGDWTFYDNNGRKMSEGFYNKKGEKENAWTWYHDNGAIKEIALYKAGVTTGENKLYYDNGNPYIMATSKNGEFEGEYKYYLKQGGLKQKKTFKNGKLSGKYLAYFDVGEDVIEFDINYKNDEVQGDALEYYANGKKYSVINFKSGMRNGNEIKYYRNGQISMQSAYKNNELNGPYASFYANGNKKSVGQSSEGYYDGPWKSYYKDGTLSNDYNYKKGSLDGDYKSYDTDGLITSDFQYRRGEIISYTFYDKSGKVLSENRKKGGEFFYEGYHPNGNKSAEGLYDIKGGKVGEWKFYDENGVLTDEGKYEEGKPVGEEKTFYKSGEIKSITTYDSKDNKSYYQHFYVSGQLKTQGWSKDDLKQGEWHYYYNDGTIEAVNFFHNGDIHGTQYYYNVDGTMDNQIDYDFDMLISERRYDKKGEVYNTFAYQQPSTSYKIESTYQNGNKKSETSYTNGEKHGPYKYYSFCGKVTVDGNYHNNQMSGDWKWYYKDGEIKNEDTYVNGNQDGSSKRYYQSGQIEDDYLYDEGDRTGKWLSYHENGKLYTSTEYVDDLNHGRKEFYSPEGKLQIVRIYDHGTLVSYTYLGTDGTEKEMIPIKNESGRLDGFFDNGKPARTMEYVNGEIHGEYKAYYYDGTLENHTTYEKGEYNGLDLEYHPNGKIKLKENMLYGDRHGLSEKFYPNGNIKERTNYLNNEKHGEVTYYDENGKLTLTEYYTNGDIYESK
ncbi:toxin-antitoxin system YwqK family antitoxin [Psychroserpens luteus]|uniref:Tetratricopeptide repeat protein n=1 Tax=Psychroserpens luteus TaxID=1434066 RepID=A0ABW5ZQ16_9FLAO|nr:toxin-antitoxin system YwqK family antitoxin [Psychroserpens luteus]